MCLVASLLSVALLASSAGATLESDVSAIKSDVSSIKTTNSNIYTRLATTNSSLSSIYSKIVDMASDVSALQTSIGYSLNTMVTHIDTVIGNLGGWMNPISGTLGKAITGADASLNDIESNTDNIASDTLSLRSDVRALKEFFVNSHHSALEGASEDTVDQATSMYGSTPNGQSTSRNAADISQFSSGISSSFNTGVSSGRAFEFLNTDQNVYGSALPEGRSGSPFAFFSYETLFDLDPSQATRSPRPDVVDVLSLNRDLFYDLVRDGVSER